ncbi:hypothetical protein Q5P01_014869 [Channa striata]|uniref:Uncharacterized protein n=1 Tax=Channa striata TaxID=64152 RepID=A0AA88MKQ7_CHASR|nr:hypothetical protein Q5P01_014869 [Channa striata]
MQGAVAFIAPSQRRITNQTLTTNKDEQEQLRCSLQVLRLCSDKCQPALFFVWVFLLNQRSPLADRTNKSTLTELCLSSVYLWSDGTHRHQSSLILLAVSSLSFC